MEKADVQVFPAAADGGQEDGVGVIVGVIKVLAVAGETAQEHPLVFVVPLVHGQQDKALIQAPGIRQAGHEGIVYHVPLFAVVLLLDIQDFKDGGTAFAHGETAELRKDVRLRHAVRIAGDFNLVDDFLHHVLVVEVLGQGSLVGQAAANVQAVQLRADGLEFTVHLDALGKLVPVIGRIPDTRVDEEMQHLEVEVGILGHGVLVELEDIRVADAQAGGIEVEIGFLLRGNTDAHHGIFLDKVCQVFELVLVVQYGNDVFPALLAQGGDVLDVLGAFEAVANDIQFVFLHGTVLFQGPDKVQVIGRRGFQVNVVLEGLVHHKSELGTLGAVAVVVLPPVIGLGHGHLEQTLGPLDLRRNLG